jgi:hypothetical protein
MRTFSAAGNANKAGKYYYKVSYEDSSNVLSLADTLPSIIQISIGKGDDRDVGKMPKQHHHHHQQQQQQQRNNPPPNRSLRMNTLKMMQRTSLLHRITTSHQ